MSVLNGETFLREAIDSILEQDFENYEFIILNNGSTDRTREIIESYSDPRIRLINKEKSGLGESLKKGVEHSQGEYIARMDSDDLSLPGRLKKQVEFLDSNAEIAMVGSSFNIIDEGGTLRETTVCIPYDDDLKRAVLVGNPFGHGTVMFRRDRILEAGNYDQNEEVEDYELWVRVASIFKTANLAEPLYSWRVNFAGVSHSESNQRLDKIRRVMDKAWSMKSLRPKQVPFKHLKHKVSSYESLDRGTGLAFRRVFVANEFLLSVAMTKRGMVVKGFVSLGKLFLLEKRRFLNLFYSLHQDRTVTGSNSNMLLGKPGFFSNTAFTLLHYFANILKGKR